MRVVGYSFEQLDKEKWSILENEAQNLSVLQTYSWAEVLKSTGIEPWFLMVIDNNYPLLGLLMFRSQFISQILCGYEVRKGPIAVSSLSESLYRFFVSSLKEMLKKKSALYFYLEPSLHVNLEPYFINQGFLMIPSATFVVDFRLPLASLWKNLEKRARWGVKKARKMGVTISEAEVWEDWEKYYKIYVHENYKKGVRPRSLNLHKSIFQHLLPGERTKLFIAKHHGKTIAGGLFLATIHEMIYYEGASDERYLNLQPNNIIQWHAISWAKQRGIRYYDLGGALRNSDKNHPLYGVHMFKRQWGGKLHRFNSFALNRFYVIGRKLSLENSEICRVYYSLERIKAVQRFDRI